METHNYFQVHDAKRRIGVKQPYPHACTYVCAACVGPTKSARPPKHSVGDLQDPGSVAGILLQTVQELEYICVHATVCSRDVPP